jgi:formylglycine-generating enzyme required for sulfatase activity
MDGFMMVVLSTTNCTVLWLISFLLSGMVRILGGPFVMGDAAEADEQPRRTVVVASFDIDADEVTRAEYTRCVQAGACRPSSLPRSDDATSKLPVTGVSWGDADAYCRFVHKRLPTEAEWERAARGTDGRQYPWGDELDCARGNFGNYDGEGRCPQNPGHPVEVGSYNRDSHRDGGDELHDLAGNVWEWVADWYAADYYRRAPSANPKGPRRGERRVVRGGACCSMLGLPRAANRLSFPPDYRDDDLGFRCAR